MSKFTYLNGTGMVKVSCDICSKANVVVAALKGFNRTKATLMKANNFDIQYLFIPISVSCQIDPGFFSP